MKKFTSALLAAILALSVSAPTFAAPASQSLDNSGVGYSIEFENDSMMDGAVKLDEVTTKQNGRVTTVTTYLLQDGTKMVDTFTRGDVSLARSANGSDTTTRTSKREGMYTVSLTASFTWRTEGNYRYVKCTNASGTYNILDSAVKKSYCNASRPTGEVKNGNVSATIAYEFYKYPNQTITNSFKITCTDTGKISDNL